VIANIAVVRAFAERLHAFGCRLALDDFGTSLGAIRYVKNLPVDELKIDGELVRGCVTGPTDRMLVAAIVGIARGLGAQTVAESVRDAAEVAALRERGVDWGQGFHLGAPAPLQAQLGRSPVAGP
jgi:EAL domain-containing protein (putative c-di-GMP-specific phosphodiesterase class I)